MFSDRFDILLFHVGKVVFFAIKGNHTSICLFQKVQTAQQRCLARARWAKNGYDITLVYLQGYILQNIQRTE